MWVQLYIHAQIYTLVWLISISKKVLQNMAFFSNTGPMYYTPFSKGV